MSRSRSFAGSSAGGGGGVRARERTDTRRRFEVVESRLAAMWIEERGDVDPLPKGRVARRRPHFLEAPYHLLGEVVVASEVDDEREAPLFGKTGSYHRSSSEFYTRIEDVLRIL